METTAEKGRKKHLKQVVVEPTLRHYHSISLEELKKTKNTLRIASLWANI
jgi:hypothetical protein